VTTGIESHKDEAVIDETPQAYKDIESGIVAQANLIEVAHTLKQVLCVKGQGQRMTQPGKPAPGCVSPPYLLRPLAKRSSKMNPRKLSNSCAARNPVIPEGS